MSCKRERDYQKEYESGNFDICYFWKEGFKPRSNRGRVAVKEWRYNKRSYEATITMSRDDYYQFKTCEMLERREKIESEDRAEYERFLYLQNKYGGSDESTKSR